MKIRVNEIFSHQECFSLKLKSKKKIVIVLFRDGHYIIIVVVIISDSNTLHLLRLGCSQKRLHTPCLL